jgi:hypothetical protein
MIRFALSCNENHAFEGWFASSADFDNQCERDLLSCPVCGSSEVKKALMTPSIAKAAKVDESQTQQVVNTAPRKQLSRLNPAQHEIVRQIAVLRDKVLSEAENVGERFPEEARKIHYGETDARGIYGTADTEDVLQLLEEGIEVIPLPESPEDKN